MWLALKPRSKSSGASGPAQGVLGSGLRARAMMELILEEHGELLILLVCHCIVSDPRALSP